VCQHDDLFREAVVDMSHHAPFTMFKLFDRTMLPRRLQPLAACRMDTADMTDGTFCPRSMPIQRPVGSASGTSIDTDSQAYQRPWRERQSLSEPG
jgi:hypothetical protein